MTTSTIEKDHLGLDTLVFDLPVIEVAGGNVVAKFEAIWNIDIMTQLTALFETVQGKSVRILVIPDCCHRANDTGVQL